MKKSLKLLSILLVICLALAFVAACDKQGEPCTSHVDANSDGICDKCGAKVDTDVPSEPVDYVSQLKLDMNSSTKKQEVTVKNYVDGDTTHFNVPKSVSETGVLKARYLAINTPESTGKIEDYGHTASRFTKAKLKSAVSIIVESDDNKWNIAEAGTYDVKVDVAAMTISIQKHTPSGIGVVKGTTAAPAAYYTIAGVKSNAAAKGLTIVVDNNGKARKVMK